MHRGATTVRELKTDELKNTHPNLPLPFQLLIHQNLRTLPTMLLMHSSGCSPIPHFLMSKTVTFVFSINVPIGKGKELSLLLLSPSHHIMEEEVLSCSPSPRRIACYFLPGETTAWCCYGLDLGGIKTTALAPVHGHKVGIFSTASPYENWLMLDNFL